jgi:hypothetical protein
MKKIHAYAESASTLVTREKGMQEIRKEAREVGCL